MDQRLEKALYKKMWMVNKHLKRSSKSLVIRELTQVKTKRDTTYILPRMAKIIQANNF